MAQAGVELPDRFTRVNYLKGNGSARMDITGAFPSASKTNRVILTYQLDGQAKIDEGLFGTYKPHKFYVYKFYRDNEIGVTYDDYYGIKNLDTKKHTVDLAYNHIFYDGNILSEKIHPIHEFPNLLLWNRYGNVDPSYSKIFSCKLYEYDKKIVDLIPCFDSKNNKPCMLDLISKIPIYNFIEGDDFTYG